MAILHCLMSLFSNSLFSADMRQHPLRTQTEKFHDRRIFVHKSDSIAFLILGHPVRHRPHMLFDHVPFQRIQCKPIHRILHGDLRMVGAVRFLTGRFCAVIRICLIKIQVVQQSCSCSRNCIPMEKATQQIIVIRYIQAVLKSCRIPMVSELFQRLHISVF